MSSFRLYLYLYLFQRPINAVLMIICMRVMAKVMRPNYHFLCSSCPLYPRDGYMYRKPSQLATKMRNKNKKSSTKQATTQLSRHVCDVLLVAMFGLRGKMWFLFLIFRKKKMNVVQKKLYHTQLYLPLNNIKSI